MGARTVTNDAEILAWVRNGKSYDEIREEYTRRGIVTSNSTFSMLASKYGLAWKSADRTNVPWRVDPAHRFDPLVTLLRRIGRLRKGQPVAEAGKVRRFMERLERDRLVVAYDPAVGFTLEPRRDGDGEFVRPPASP